MSVSEKVKCIDGNDKKLSISRQCELLQLPRSSYYRPRSSLAEGKAFTGGLKDHGVQISMDGKGRCMDNIFIERLWRSVKHEKIFLEEFETVPELLSGLKAYFEFYNFERPHQSLVGKTPAEIYWGREVARKAHEL